MRTGKLLQRLVSLLIASMLLTALAACGAESTENSITGQAVNKSFPGVTPQITPEMVAVSGSYRSAQSLSELVSKNEFILIGQMSSAKEIINLARNPADVMQADPNIYIAGQVYQISVERYIKGNGDKIAEIVQPEAMISNPGPNISVAEINKAKPNYSYIPLQANVKYLFFLNRLEGFAGKNYLVGNIHPWRFILPDKGLAQPESPWHGAIQIFPPKPVITLVNEVEQISANLRNGSNTTITPTVPEIEGK